MDFRDEEQDRAGSHRSVLLLVLLLGFPVLGAAALVAWIAASAYLNP